MVLTSKTVRRMVARGKGCDSISWGRAHDGRADCDSNDNFQSKPVIAASTNKTGTKKNRVISTEITCIDLGLGTRF